LAEASAAAGVSEEDILKALAGAAPADETNIQLEAEVRTMP
jgi:hypothetical protein